MKQALLGLIYGCLLTAIGVVLAGAGHGTYMLLALASSPIGVLGTLAAVFGAPVLWMLIGWLLGNRDKHKAISLAVMLSHYVGAVYLLTASEFADWDWVAKNWGGARTLLIGAFAFYAAGQILIWITFLRPTAKQEYPR